jgi:hypothetical protein
MQYNVEKEVPGRIWVLYKCWGHKCGPQQTQLYVMSHDPRFFEKADI